MLNKLASLLMGFGLSIPAIAQMHSNLIFTGTSRLGVNGMGDDFWTTNQSDTLRFSMTSASTGDITLPNMFYSPMGYTMKGFTLSGARFTLGAGMSVNFEQGQQFEMTIDDNGEQKSITATLDSASWSHSGDMAFNIALTFKYGRMPFPATYIASLPYNRVATGIAEVKAVEQGERTFDLQGRPVSDDRRKGIVIKGGKKILKK